MSCTFSKYFELGSLQPQRPELGASVSFWRLARRVFDWEGDMLLTIRADQLIQAALSERGFIDAAVVLRDERRRGREAGDFHATVRRSCGFVAECAFQRDSVASAQNAPLGDQVFFGSETLMWSNPSSRIPSSHVGSRKVSTGPQSL